MKLTVNKAKLIERRSDERNNFELANALRKAAVARGTYAEDLTTTTAAVTEIWRDTVNADSAMVLRVTVCASQPPNYAAYDRRVVVTRTGSAAAVIQATDTIGTDFETVGAWDITFSVSTGDIVLSVTGAATWRADITAVWSPFK